MKTLYLLPLLAFATAGQAQQRPQDDGKTIVVTARSLAETKRALRDCLARRCPTEEDINATLAHAENLFVAGDYKEARRITRASLGRNGGRAKQHPVPVSDLYRANARISAHLGESGDFQRSSYGIRRALKAGLGEQDPRLVGAHLEVAGMHASLGRVESARHAYQEAEKDALAIGRPDLAATARVRSAWLFQLSGEGDIARTKLRAIAQDRSPGTRVARLTALVLLARLDRQDGKRASSDALIEELRGAGFSRPVLLFSPPMELHTRRVAEGQSGSVTRMMATDTFEDKWIDVGFWVTPEGRVSDLEILRRSGTTDWTDPVLRSIGGRIYSPSAGEGAYRVERYTYTSNWGRVSGTLLREREQDARIEFLDLTEESPAQTR